MDTLYEVYLNPKRMADATNFTAISLGGDPANPRSGPVMLKLFYESDVEDEEAELYLNIDAGKSRLVLAEKDPDYRKAVVLALMKKSN